MAVHRTGADDAAHRAVTLIRDHLSDGALPGAVAVLARVNSALLPVQVALTEAAIPHTAPLDATVLGRTGVRTALAYLRIGLDLDRIRRDDVLDTINRPTRKVKSAVAPLLRRSGRWSMQQLEQVADSLDPVHADRFLGYLGDLHHLAAAVRRGADTATCLSIVRDRIGLGEAMDALDASRTRPEGSSHGDDLDALAQLAALHPEVASFRDWLVDRLRVPGDPAGVTLSTVHRVKGMEWDRVVVFAANAGLFPHRLADDVEEERRVFHVALTRCRDRVDVIAVEDRVSPFVADLSRAADGRPRPASAGTAAAATSGPTEPRRAADGAVVAEAGLEVTVVGGFRGHVTAVSAAGASVSVADGDGPPLDLEVVFGEPVTIAGDRTRLAPPPRVTAPSSRTPRLYDGTAGAGRSAGAGADATGDLDVDEALFEALRAWRSGVAADGGIPAYLVFHDRHLKAIAGRKPRSVRELAACPGVGPAKLERYADDVLDLVDQHP